MFRGKCGEFRHRDAGARRDQIFFAGDAADVHFEDQAAEPCVANEEIGAAAEEKTGEKFSRLRRE